MHEIGRHLISTRNGEFLLIGHLFGDNQQVVVTVARIPTEPDDARPWLLRVQYGCLNATAFQAVDCDCGAQIENSLRKIDAHGKGLFVYFRDHEAFGLGLAEKIRVVAEEKRRDLPFEEVVREKHKRWTQADVTWVVPEILDSLNIDSGDAFVLLSSCRFKEQALRKHGLSIERTEAA